MESDAKIETDESINGESSKKTYVEMSKIPVEWHIEVEDYKDHTMMNGYYFGTQDSIAPVNVKYHDESKEYPCDACPKSFGCYRSLKSHKANDCGKTYTCTTCGKTFNYRASYCRHRKRCVKLETLSGF